MGSLRQSTRYSEYAMGWRSGAQIWVGARDCGYTHYASRCTIYLNCNSL